MSKDKLTYEQAMKMALEHLKGGQAEMEVVGQIPEDKIHLIMDLYNKKEQHQAYHDELDAKLEAYQDQLFAEHEPICEKLKKEIDQLYDDVVESTGLVADDYIGVPLEINAETGEIRAEKKGPVN